DLGCATSSIRIRRWTNAGKTVHHIIDPRTGQPGGAGLQAVTVVGPDPAEAEVWSKSLFLAGVDGIAEVAERQNLAALWISDDDQLGVSTAMDQYVIWTRPETGVTK
ncbi:MAG: FAD:protein FMN transferase, partial [Actinomycetes bacterium]